MSKQRHKAPEIKLPPRALNPYDVGPAKFTKFLPLIPDIREYVIDEPRRPFFAPVPQISLEEYARLLGYGSGQLSRDPPPDKYAHITAAHIDESRLPPPLTDWRGSRN